MSITHLMNPASKLFAPTKYASGNYYHCTSPQASTSSATLGNGTVRGTVWAVGGVLPLASMFAEFLTAGEASSVFRIGIWRTDDFGKPGPLVLDAGTISTGSGNAGTVATGGTPGVYEIPVSSVLQPGLYFVGGAAQGAPTTQPNMRCVSPNVPFIGGPLGTALPGVAHAALSFGFSAVGAFSAGAPSSSALSSAPRIGFKVA